MTGHANERGMAMIAALLVMLLMSALMIGFTAVVINDQQFRGIDKDRLKAYYGAQSGLEKLTVDMGNLFLTSIAPTAAQIAALGQTSNEPVLSGITYSAPAGVTAYGAALVPCDNLGDTSCQATVQTGPYQGLIALKKSYQIDAVAVTAAGGEAHLTRKLELVSIPVFQFGTFSTVDLSFFAGNAFSFGGRVHTNGNLFLTAQTSYTTTLTDKVTAVGDVIRQTMQNGLAIVGAGFNGTVSMAKASGSYRNLAATEGSLTGGVGSSVNTNWPTISLTTYNGYIRNGGCPPATGCSIPARGTGAKTLNLALVTVGGTNTDLVRRPPVNEIATNPVLFGERIFGKASMRILLSDTAADITNLPTVTATAPIHLGDEGTLGVGLTNDWSVLGNQPPGLNVAGTAIPSGGGLMPSIARSPGPQAVVTTSGATAANAATVPIVGANPLGFFNVPGTGAATSMQFTVNTAAGVLIQKINCLTVTATSATQITFGSCLRANALGGLAAVNSGSKIIVTDGNGTTNTFITTGNVGTTSNNTTTQNYVVTSTNALNALVINTFWMQSNAATKDWSVVTCSGITTGTNTANAGPFTVTALSTCSGVPATNNGASLVSAPALVAQNVGTIGGYIKIEIQKADFTWVDVTAEILNWGFADTNQLEDQAGTGTICANPTPNAIIRLQRLRDNAASNGLGCTYAGSINSYDYWPNTIFDTREALLREITPATNDATVGGTMHYVTIDVGNLSKWLAGSAPYAAGSGPAALSVSGFTIYFSDRRNNRADGTNGTTLNAETGEYGFEDLVNPANAAGTPNGVLDTGEDVNGNALLDTYGQFPNFMGTINTLPPGAAAAPAPFNAAGTIRPFATFGREFAMTSRPYLFRRALKLQNGGQGNIVMPGLSIVTENPVYIQGDWNWNGGALTNAHAETSVLADAVTLLSSAWIDANSFVNPYDATQRLRAANDWYRLAIIGGKGMGFPWPSAGSPDSTFGTDGGVHNFLKYLEEGPGTVNYVGATATFYYSRQAVGIYKFGSCIVYCAPTRAYAFDTDFLNPATLPPLTPVFRDVDILGYSQEMRPGK